MNKLAVLALGIICWIPSVFLYAAPADKPDVVDVLVIDAGHGGTDPGAVGRSAVEKDIALKVALRFGKAVQEKYPGVKVIYTRKTDVFVELWRRGQIANDNHADLFVSIHCNSSKSAAAKGTETWVRGAQKDGANLEEVKRENAVIMKEENYQQHYSEPWLDVVNATMMQDAGFENSVYFSGELQKIYARRIPRSPDRSVKQGPFQVLWKSARPSVLTEIGFISNAEEEKFLISEEGQNTIVECLVEAFGKYKRRIDSRSGLWEEPAAEMPAPVVEPTAPVAPQPEPEAPQTASAVPESAPEFIPSPKEVIHESGEPANVAGEPAPVKESVSAVEPAVEPAPAPAAESSPAVLLKVQIFVAAQKMELEPSRFKGLSPLSVWFDKNKNLYKYYYAQSASYAEIQQFLEEAKAVGYKDAYVVAFEGENIIPLRDALDKLGQLKR